MSLNAIDRKRVILELIDKEEKVKTIDLVKILGVSSESVRRYLDELESENKLKKVYGGAIKIDRDEPELIKRNNINTEAKISIAEVASNFVEDNDCIVIDEGTTCLHMIQYIINKKNLTIVTNSCTVLFELINCKNKGLYDGEVIFVGGKVNSKHERTAGQIAMEIMDNIFVDKAFISVEGFLDTFGISSADQNKALLSRTYMKNSKENFVLCDGSKIGRASVYKIADIVDIDRVISDIEAPKEWDETLLLRNIDWVKA